MRDNGSGAITLCLAPLHGVTDHLFRQAFFNHFPGFDSAMAPFIASIHSDRIRRLHFRDLMPAVNAGIHLIPQILSSDAPGMVKTISLLAGMGYDEVNWNLGCPFPRVTGKGRGSGMLPHPERIRSILDETCPLLQTDLSIKLRLGLSDSADILRLVPLFNEYPLKRIFIHPRIGVQMYRGEVDLERFGEALALSRHEVVYNGDIKTCEDLAALRQRFPRIREWMIGRWALRDPFLPGRIKGLAEETDPVPRIRSFHEELYNRYCRALNGPHHVLNKMKEIWQYLGDALPQRRVELGKLAKSATSGEYESWAERILG